MHVAIIMDGNGRWAAARGLPRSAGHRRGVDSVRRVVEAAPGLGIRVLTLYAFSCDNWRRPAAEVSTLMDLLRRYLAIETPRCRARGIRLEIIGRKDRLSPRLQAAIRRAQRVTAAGERLQLRLAVDYSSRWAIATAAAGGSCAPDEFLKRINRVVGTVEDTPDVDLVIRTSGEQRLSDFLLWESAYAELVFTKTPWPEFDGEALRRSIDAFSRRDRRFGSVGSG